MTWPERKDLKRQNFCKVFCTFVSELTNGICITLKITVVALNGEDPLLYFLKCTCAPNHTVHLNTS